MIHAWTRYWTKPDGRISLADQGFLVGPGADNLLIPGSADLWTFDEIAARRCLILLGEPGMGKSETLRAEAASASARAVETGDLVLRVNLGATREESVLRQEIFQSAQFQAWVDGDGELLLFLDSLDEAVLRLGVVGDIILKGVTGVDTSRLRLRLACRTADRLRGFEESLLALWPEEQAGVYELAPLRKADVRMAAGDRGGDPDEFIAHLLEREIVPFAIKPVTLEMLLDLAQEDDGLPTNQLELYDRGLLRLVAESGERRHRDPHTRGQLTPGQRISLASRIAGATIITGHGSIATADTSQSTPDIVTLAQLAGGTERDSSIAVPTAFQVSDEGLREVLNTGLFSARSDDLGWAHQTYGEYLAARYLTATEMSLRQILALLVADADDGRIVPQLSDVAGWAAVMDPALMDELATRDPLALLRGDIATADDQRKGRLAEALLTRRVAEELDWWDSRVRRNIERLDHDGLEDIVRGRLIDSAEPEPVRQLACRIAQVCELAGLKADLVGLALRTNEHVRLRTEAVRALETTADPETRRQLISLAREALPEDADDELKGAVLRAVCPSVITAAETLAFLTPQKARDLIGAYSTFLYRDLPRALTQEELPSALEWIRRMPDTRDPMDEFGNLAEQILVRGAESMDRQDVLEALVGTVAEYLREDRDLQSFRTLDTSDAFSAESNRHRLVAALVPLMRDGRLDPIAVIGSTPRLVSGSDLQWLIERLAETVGGDDEATWAELIDWTASFESADQDLIMVARQTSPILYERTRVRFGPIDLNSELAARLRSHHEREQQRAESRRRLSDDAPDFDAEVDSLLDRFELGDLDSFWQLNISIWGEEGRRNVALGGSDMTKSPVWQRATPARRARIGAAAGVYLRAYEPSDTWLDPSLRFHAATAGYRAIRYVVEHAPESFAALETTTLCRWIPAILTFTRSDVAQDDSHFDDWLLREVSDRCFERLADAVRQLVMAEAEHGEGHLFVLYRLQPLLADNLGSRLLDLWQEVHDDLRPEPQSQLLKALLRTKVPGAIEAGLDALVPESPSADPERARTTAAALLEFSGIESWQHVWPILRDHPDWGAGVFESLAHESDRAGDFRSGMKETELAELFIWLSGRFPPEQDPSRSGAHFVGPREQVGAYRDQILGLLINRGTAESLLAFDRIEAETGQDLGHARIRGEEAWRRNCWVPPRPEDVIRLAGDAQRRVVLSDADLQRVIVESLERIQHMLAEGQAHQVWDTAVGRPKQETEVAAWIADRMHDDLHGRGIIINREVEIRVNPLGGIGDRTDIHIDALAGERVEGAEQVTVVIEVKGCWHRELLTAMQTQLAENYLSQQQRRGIYLVVWFSNVGWNDANDSRRQICGRLNRDDVVHELHGQAERLRADGFEIMSVALDATLR